jgi:hypothetical protein
MTPLGRLLVLLSTMALSSAAVVPEILCSCTNVLKNFA